MTARLRVRPILCTRHGRRPTHTAELPSIGTPSARPRAAATWPVGNCGAATQVTQSGLTLADGATYYFAVTARSGAGQWSAVGTSDGITVDLTPPTTPVVTDDGAITTSGASLHASWISTDPQSGIAQYQYAIGTSAVAHRHAGWTSAGTAVQVTQTGLTLTSGVTYYFAVKAMNGAARGVRWARATGLRSSQLPPTTPVVTDDGVFTTSLTTLHAYWSSTDRLGIAEYDYAIGTSAGATDVVGWTSAGEADQVIKSGLTLTNGATYYFAAKAKDIVGLWSAVGMSDGITVDTTPPAKPVVVDDGAYTSSTDTLHATWSATDPISGIAQYQYAIGTSAGGVDVLGWTSAGTATQVTAASRSITGRPTTSR